jgi:hypothetical protein
MLRYVIPLLAIGTFAQAQTPTSNASVMVAHVENEQIFAGNNLSRQVSADLAGRLAFSLLTQEWIRIFEVDTAQTLDTPDGPLTLEDAARLMLLDGREGDIARTSVARLIGYTPKTLQETIFKLFDDMHITATNMAVERSEFGGPKWAGTISVKDVGRLGIALEKLHGDTLELIAAGSGLQCLTYQEDTHNGGTLMSLVTGATSSQGCLEAAQQAIALTFTRFETTPNILSERALLPE